MFVTKRSDPLILWPFLSISSLFKISKIGLRKLFCKWKFLCKVEKGVALTSDYICLQKMKKGTLFVGSRACAANHYAIAENFPYVQSSSGVDFAESRVR